MALIVWDDDAEVWDGDWVWDSSDNRVNLPSVNFTVDFPHLHSFTIDLDHVRNFTVET